MAIGGTFLDSMCKDGQGSITSCNVVFGLYVQNTIVQTEIRNFGWENRAIWGGNFPLTDLEIKSIFLIIVFLSRCQVNPRTKPLTFRGVK